MAKRKKNIKIIRKIHNTNTRKMYIKREKVGGETNLNEMRLKAISYSIN